MSITFTCPLCKEQSSVGPEFAGRRGTCASCGVTVIVPQTSGVARLPPQLAQDTARKSGLPWVLILAAGCAVLLVCGSMLAFLLFPAVMAGRRAAEIKETAITQAVEDVREAGRRASCSNQLKQICLALFTYESKHGRFPPAATIDDNGRPLMSWRIAILPYMERDSLYGRYDPKQPWNSPKNLDIVKPMPRVFRCPSDSSAADGETSYVMITGQNTVGGVPGSPGTRTADVTDGLSKTILVIEVYGLKIPWTEPRDITLDELVSRLQSGGQIGHVASFNVALADGTVRGLPTKIDAETLRRLATINDGLPVEIDQF